MNKADTLYRDEVIANLNNQLEKKDTLYKLVDKLIQYKMCMSYNDSYFGEPKGLLKCIVSEMDIITREFKIDD